jgi:arylsulfatase
MENPAQRGPLVRTALSSACTAATLNLAVSLLGHPRALAEFPALLLPLAAGFSLFLAASFLLLGFGTLAAPLLGLERERLRGTLAGALVLAATLQPLVEVGLRDTTSERAAVLWSVSAGFVACAGFAAYFLVGARPARLVRCAPLCAPFVLVGVWGLEFRGETFTAPWSAHRAATSDLAPVVLLTVDTLRADRVLGAGAARVPTPAIDALAADSIVFTRARSAAPWTKPSLATLLTGVSPLVHGMTTRRARLPAELETLAERLRAAGYRTAGIGLNAHLERAFRFDQGFDDYAFPARHAHGVSLGAKVLERLASERYPEVFPSTTAIADVALDWLDQHGGEPFFLWVHVLDPHWPYEPPDEWVAEPERAPRRWGEPEMVTNVQAGNTKPGAAERERVAELYAGEIRYVDHELARILAKLEELGVYERALVAFASDHGEEFWEHGRYEHGHTLYDEVLRVPLFLKLPGETPVQELAADVTTEALVPTMLDVLGIAHDPESFTARSLAPFWNTPGTAAAEPIFASGTYYFGEKRAVVFDGRKLVLELDTTRSELYDLGSDPRELRALGAADTAELRRGFELLTERERRCLALRERLGIRSVTGLGPDEAVLESMQQLGYGGASHE